MRAEVVRTDAAVEQEDGLRRHRHRVDDAFMSRSSYESDSAFQATAEALALDLLEIAIYGCLSSRSLSRSCSSSPVAIGHLRTTGRQAVDSLAASGQNVGATAGGRTIVTASGAPRARR